MKFEVFTTRFNLGVFYTPRLFYVLFLWEVLEICTIPLVTFPDIDHASELPRNHSSYCVAI